MEGNMDPVQDNPAANGAAGTETDAGLETIMTGMADSTTPDTKPGESTAGDKVEGKGNGQEKAADLPAWTSQLPDELKNNADVMKQLTKFGKIGDLAKSYSELEGKLGKSLIQPGKDASEEELNSFYQKLGKPERAEAYSIKGDEAQAFRELAYKNNLTDAQAVSLYEQFKAMGEKAVQQQQLATAQKAKATEDALKAEYGNAYADKLKLLQRGVQTYGGPTLGAKLKQSGLLYDQDVVKMFILLGEQSQEAGSYNKGTSAPKEYKSTSEGGSFTFKGI